MGTIELYWGALLEGIIFLTYAVICISLAESRFSRKFTMRFYGIMGGSILLLQSAMIFSGQDIALVTTLLPVTAYLPFIIGVYVLTGFQLSQTASIGMLGSIIVHILKILNKTAIRYYVDWPWEYKALPFLMIPVIMILAGAFVFLVLRFFRKPFRRYMESAHAKDWLLLFLPALMSYLLLSYFSNSTRDMKVFVILLLLVICVFVMVLRIVFFQSIVLDMKESEQKMEVRLQAQRQEYEEIARKMEAGRIYRHDMRHHLLVINELAMQEDVSGILNYVENMNGKLAETEREFYCANAMINTMLSACIGQAKAAGCAVSTEVQLPEEICFDEMDVCMILANALENAVNACKKIAEEKERYIRIKAGMSDNGRLFILICNSCNDIPQFGKDGFPVSDARKKSEEHGIGLKSIRVLVEKYQGFIQCRCSEGEFRFQAVLFGEQRKEVPAALTEERKSVRKKRYISGACIAGSLLLFLIVYLISASSAVSETMWKEFAQGSGVRLQKHEWSLSWGVSYLNVSVPILEAEDTISSSPLTDLADNGGDVEEWNSQVQEYIDEMKKRFLNYYVRRNYGYVGCDVNWEVLRDDEVFLSVCMTATINAGGSGEYSRCFTWDKENGKTLALKDLFLEDSDYIGVVSEEILRQMTERVQNGQGNYFIPGGIWREDECFKQISVDQNFYLNEENDLVIIFNEYEVAPGSMGMPQFVIEQEVLADILCQRFLVNDEAL